MYFQYAMSKINFVSYILIILIFFSILGCISKDSNKEDELEDYTIIFLKSYKEIIEFSNLSENDKNSITFYKNYPYDAYIGISSIHGIGIEFTPSNNKNIHSNFEDINIIKINKSLEEHIWPRGSQSYYDSNSPYLQNDGFMYVNNSFFGGVDIINGPNSTIIIPQKSIIFSNGDFIKINQGYIFINGTLIIQNSNNLFIFKGMNDKSAWSEEQAKIDADIISFEFIKNVFFKDAEISNSSALTSLKKQASIIDHKLKNGEYYDQNEVFDKQELDFDKIEYFKIAIEGNIKTDVAEDYLNDLQKAENPDIFTKINEIWSLKLFGLIALIYSILMISIKIIIIFKYRSLKFLTGDCTLIKDIKILVHK